MIDNLKAFFNVKHTTIAMASSIYGEFKLYFVFVTFYPCSDDFFILGSTDYIDQTLETHCIELQSMAQSE